MSPHDDRVLWRLRDGDRRELDPSKGDLYERARSLEAEHRARGLT